MWGQQYIINTIAGDGTDAFAGDGGPASKAEVSSPSALAIDAAGKIYIADGGVHRVRVIAANGNISTLAGTGTPGFTGDGAAATTAQLNGPGGIAVDPTTGNVYIADTGNTVIRMISGTTITTVAGNYTLGPGYTGDGGAATGAQLAFPTGVAVDSSGNLYIADQGNNVIRVVSGGTILTVGAGGNFKLKAPASVAVDVAGNLFISDTDNSRIVEYSVKGVWSVVAGTGSPGFSGDKGPATQAALSLPRSVGVDALGQLYICDTLNGRIRLVAPTGVITTIAGNGSLSYSGDGGDALAASLYLPRGIAVDPAGNVYIADTGNHRIREAQAVPVISQNGVVNAASFAAQLAPGALATVFGQHFAAANTAGSAPLPSTLAGVSISLNGKALPLLYATPFQVNFQVPSATAAGNATITVTSNGLTSASTSVPVLTAAPGLFQQASGRAVVQNSADFSLNSPSAPAKLGSTIIAYLTGAGAVQPAVADGVVAPNSLSTVIASTSATIGTASAKVSFAGMTPGFIGLQQMNIVVPAAGLTTGDYPLTVTVNGQASNSATVSVTQ